MGISQNPVGSHGTPGENVTAFPRLPRRFAPRNDTSGKREVHQRPHAVELPCTGRSQPARGTPQLVKKVPSDLFRQAAFRIAKSNFVA